jgi:hypothetical protein
MWRGTFTNLYNTTLGNMKQLEKEFMGRGEVKGFKFTQLFASSAAFLYKVCSGSSERYEVFLRKENTQFECISYPSSKAFGVWAWSFQTLEKAIERYKLIQIQHDTLKR